MKETLKPLYDFLKDHLKERDYCRLSNVLIGNLINEKPVSISNKLTQLKKLGFFITTNGHPVGAGFAPDNTVKGRRIYKSNHPDVIHLSNDFKAAEPPSKYDSLYQDKSAGIVDRHMRHHPGLSVLSKLIYVEICMIAADGGVSAPAQYYSDCFSTNISNIEPAFQSLYDLGFIWWVKNESIWYYGTTIGLLGQMAMMAGSRNQRELKRLTEIIDRHTKFGSKKKMKAALMSYAGENLHHE